MHRILGRLPHGSGLLMLSIGLYLLVLGAFAPSLVYYNQPHQWVNSLMGIGQVLPVDGWIQHLDESPPLGYTLKGSAAAPVHALLISNDTSGKILDLGVSGSFDEHFTVWSGDWNLEILNPTGHEVLMQLFLGTTPPSGYPWLAVAQAAGYMILLVVAGSTLLVMGGGRVFVDRREPLPKLRRKVVLLFLFPFALGLADASLTYANVTLFGAETENSPIAFAMYQTGPSVGLLLGVVTCLMLLSLSVFCYGLWMNQTAKSRVFGLALMSSLAGAMTYFVLSGAFSLAFNITSSLGAPFTPPILALGALSLLVGVCVFALGWITRGVTQSSAMPSSG